LRTCLSFLTAALVVSLVAVGVSAAATGRGVPCWQQLLNQAFAGQIYTTFPVRCYAEALARVPRQGRFDGDVAEIEVAKLAAAPLWVREGVTTLRMWFAGDPTSRDVHWGARRHERWVTVVFPALETCIAASCLHNGPRSTSSLPPAVTGRRVTMTWYRGTFVRRSWSIEKH
jgi:hypothetical protein